MMSSDYKAVQTALDVGDKRGARRLLKPLLDADPSAELWWMAACACESEEQEIGCLRRALKLDSKHAAARARYSELRHVIHDNMMPPLESLVEELPPVEMLTDFTEFIRTPEPVNIQAVKANKRRQQNRRWTVLGCGGSILMSLSLSYIVMTVLGSPIPAQLRSFLSGDAPAAPSNAQPIFGKPVPTSETQPEFSLDNGNSGGENTSGEPMPTPDGNPHTYADDAAAGGYVVSPNKTEAIVQGKAVTDVLDPGYAHEYTFSTTAGSEFAIAVQFFSPTASDVGANVAILDSDGVNAESHCERDAIFVDGSSVAFICQVHRGGTWKLQVFGRDGQSTGVYVVAYDRM